MGGSGVNEVKWRGTVTELLLDEDDFDAPVNDDARPVRCYEKSMSAACAAKRSPRRAIVDYVFFRMCASTNSRYGYLLLSGERLK